MYVCIYWIVVMFLFMVSSVKKKKPFYFSIPLHQCSLLTDRKPPTYRVHGNAFGNAGGPCIIILTRGRNELFFGIIFKEKVIFCSLYFSPPQLTAGGANETDAFIFRCQLWQIVWKIINRNLRPSSLTSSITFKTKIISKTEQCFERTRNACFD